MPNTSATGGGLLPIGTPLQSDLQFDLTMQFLVTGVTGIPGQLVRPRWQPSPPAQPLAGTDWCAIGTTQINADTNAVLSHDSQDTPPDMGDGQDILIRHESASVLCSFYGPNAVGNASVLRDGLSVSQNVEQLELLGIRFIESGRISRVPDLINQLWINRADISLTFRRKVCRTYAVLNLLSATGAINAETITETFDVENPA
jgi:hypothetical protein